MATFKNPNYQITQNYNKLREKLAETCDECGEKVLEGGAWDVPVKTEGSETLYKDLCADCLADFEEGKK